MERDSIRKIVLAEIALFKSENFNSQEGEGPISKLETLEVLTRPEVYNASPDAIQKSIDNEFKEVTGLNSTIAATFLMGLGMGCGCICCEDEEDEENPFEELATADEETKKEFQFMTDFLGFLADNPAAFGMGDETQVAEAFKKLKESFANQDGSALKEGLEKFQEIIMGGIHSCVKVFVDNVDLSAETVVFDFVDDTAQKEFCEYFKVPVKSESMVMATGCRFRNGLPKAGREYLLNIVELEDEVTFEEVTDHAVIGLKVDLRNITYDPFYDEDGDDDDGDDSFFEDDDDPGITPEALHKVKAFLDSLEGGEDNDADYPDGGGSDPSDVDGNFYLILGGIPVAAASAGSDSWPAEYLYSDGSLKDSMLDDIEAKVLSLPEINSEGEIEINVPFIEKKLEGQKFATVDTYKRSFVDTAKRGLVVFDYDFDNDRFIWIARPKNLVDTSLLHGDTLSVDDDFGNPVESFYITEMVREVRP